MKTIQKILIFLLIAICVFSILPHNTVFATDDKDSPIGIIGDITPVEPSGEGMKGLAEIAGRILAVLQLITGLATVLVIAFTGFNFLTGSAEVKDEMKKKMIPIVVGLILVFSAITIGKMVTNIVSRSNLEGARDDTSSINITVKA